MLGLAVGAVLLVLVSQFGSLRGPLAIVLAIPLGLTGAVAALAATGVPFNVSSFMGVILLVGLIVKNGILLLDAAQHRVGGRSHAGGGAGAGGADAPSAHPHDYPLHAGGCWCPSHSGSAPGAELQRPLALAVIGGLVVSTLVTLLVVPVFLEIAGELGGSAPGSESRHEAGHVSADSRDSSPKRSRRSGSSSSGM